MGLKRIATLEEPKRPRLRKITPQETRTEEKSLAQEIGTNFIQALKDVRTEAISPIAQGVSTAAFGIPRETIKRISPKAEEFIFPEQTTLEGKALTGALIARGLFRGGAATLAKKAGGLIKGSKAGSKIARGAVEGATGAGTQIIPTKGEESLGGTVKDQVLQSFMGAFLGAGISGLGLNIGRTLGQLKKPEVKARGKVIGTGLGFSKTGRFFKKLSKKTERTGKEVIRRSKKTLTEERQLNSKIAQKQAREATKAIKDNITILDDELTQKASVASKKFKERVPEFLKANSETYGNKLDEISDLLAKNDELITRSELRSIADKSLKEMDGIADFGSARQKIELFKNKYDVDFIAGQQPKSFSTPISAADDVIPFREFVEDWKIIKKSLSAGVKAKTSKFAQEDIAVSIFNKNVGEVLANKVGGQEFLELQKVYSGNIEFMKDAVRLLKPFKAGSQRDPVVKFLKDVGLGKKGEGALETLQKLEEGTDFARGVGKITSGVRKTGQEIKELERTIQPTRRAILDRATKIDDILSKKLKRLGFKEDRIRQLLRDRSQKNKLIKIIGLRAGTTIGAGLAFEVGRRFGLFSSR